MEKPLIPADDLLDVMEMTKKIESEIGIIFDENEFYLSISALMGATINTMIQRCQSLEELVLHRDLFVQIFDASIREIQIERK